MKRLWPRILSTFTTLAVGLAGASIVRFFPAPAAEVRPVHQVEFQNEMISVLRQIPTSDHVYKEHHTAVTSWKAKKVETFIKGPTSQQINFDSQRPVVSGGLGASFDAVSITNAEFLQYNYRDLLRIAAGGNAKQKAWLRNYLENCDESLEKHSLQTALGGVQP